jgi:hypothetical protein
LREGKALGSEKGKGLGINFDITVARTALERNFDVSIG